jgi:hypothetical protein
MRVFTKKALSTVLTDGKEPPAVWRPLTPIVGGPLYTGLSTANILYKRPRDGCSDRLDRRWSR